MELIYEISERLVLSAIDIDIPAIASINMRHN